jgi:hypothetical protein
VWRVRISHWWACLWLEVRCHSATAGVGGTSVRRASLWVWHLLWLESVVVVIVVIVEVVTTAAASRLVSTSSRATTLVIHLAR